MKGKAERYRSVTARNIDKSDFWTWLSPDLREDVQVVSQVLPFRSNEYVLRELIDWSRVPEDPMYQLTFVQRGMLKPRDYLRLRGLVGGGASKEEIQRLVQEIRWSLNPHPAGQKSHNIPNLDGEPLQGLQHKYDQTVLFFPSQGQTCHAYCTYCFRWAQFVDLPEMRFEARESEGLVAYLKAHPEISDVLITGGDPLIMKTHILRRYVEPLLNSELANLRHIRIGSKALSYWPQRFVSDADADDLLRLFEEISASGRHMALMAHFSHPVELRPRIVEQAVERIRSTGAEIRLQAPLVRHVNDEPETWAEMWLRAVRLGIIPYYMFVERDTGPRNYFEVPLARVHEIFRRAYSRVSGLARTVRGPLMSAFPGKARVLGTAEVQGEKCFALDFIQARDSDWVRRPFFARFDPDACWLDQLRPAFGRHRFFYEEDLVQQTGTVGKEAPVAEEIMAR